VETRNSRVNSDSISKEPATARERYDCIRTIADPATKSVQCNTARELDWTLKQFAREYMDVWVPPRGIPLEIVTDRNSHYVRFWGITDSPTGN